MHQQVDLADITFSENGDVEVGQLNTLYRLVGWDRSNRRTAAETVEMLRVSHYYIAAQTAAGVLIGFARVCGDPYVAQVLDVITHPEYRHRGVATKCMRGVVAHLERSRYVSVTTRLESVKVTRVLSGEPVVRTKEARSCMTCS
jgi:predicted GNAT family acetyltransferase